MEQAEPKQASTLMIVIAFATIYIVWGSTYFFIQQALGGFPPMILGAARFLVAGILVLAWCIIKGEKIFIKKDLKHAAVAGLLLLFIGNGMVIWVEQTIPSAMAAILVSSAPLWFVILDRPKWQTNLRNKRTIAGLVIGFVGVILLFSQPLRHALSGDGPATELSGLFLLAIGVLAWSGGSLYAKYHPAQGAPTVTIAWQMLFAGLAFVPGVFVRSELNEMDLSQVSGEAWFALIYLITIGSIAAFSAYVWLLKVRPATQVSTYAYVNPIVAVLLGVLLANETITALQLIGLGVILTSVLLINLSNYIKKHAADRIHNEPVKHAQRPVADEVQ